VSVERRAEIDHLVRHTPGSLAVPVTMNAVRAAFPLIRALVLATIVTLLIMIGLPTLLAAAAAAATY
jgi:hypothetical protein